MVQNQCFQCPLNRPIMWLLAAIFGGGLAVGAESQNSGFRRDGQECASMGRWANESLRGEASAAASPTPRGLAENIPFSFTFGGKPSSQLLEQWKRKTTDEPAAVGSQRRTITWTDEQTGLEVSCEATVFSDFPAVEWILWLKNKSDKETPILEDLRPLSLKIGVDEHETAIFHYARGSTMSAQDYQTIDATLQPGQAISLPGADALSQTYLPYFNLQWKDGGIIGAIGWTGQWALSAAQWRTRATDPSRPTT